MKFTKVRTLYTLRCITGELLQQAKLLTLIRSFYEYLKIKLYKAVPLSKRGGEHKFNDTDIDYLIEIKI